jgi:hypothetical protein
MARWPSAVALRYNPRMRAYLCGLVFVLGAACKSESTLPSSAAASSAERDALWAMAPRGADSGIVISPRGLDLIERAVVALEAVADKAPDLAPLRAWLARGLAAAGMSKLRLAALGLTARKGFALFTVGGAPALMVIPVDNRDVFLTQLGGRRQRDLLVGYDHIGRLGCKYLQDLYVCAIDPVLFDNPGHGEVPAVLRSAGGRGDLEIVARPRSEAPSFVVVGQFERGAVTLRGTLSNLPRQLLDYAGPPAAPRAGSATASTFGVAVLTPLLAKLPAVPLAPGITLAQLARTVAGPLTFAMAGGTSDPDIQLPLSDPAPVRQLVEHCNELPMADEVDASANGGVCRVPLPWKSAAVEARVEGNQLRIAVRTDGRASAPTASPLVASPLAEELARGAWSIALFGRGTAFEPNLGPATGLLSELPGERRSALRAVALINEMGFGVRRDGDTLQVLWGVRTAWANPDDVVDKLLAITPDDIMSGKASGAARSIAAGATSSPFAQDLKAGAPGLLVTVTSLGILTAIAVPALMDSMKRTRKTEAARQLERIGDSAQRAFAQTGAFPGGTAPLTPADPCCGGPNNHCVTTPADWQRPAWKALGFAIHEPALFQYSYESDGKTFLARAVGDLDCDTTMITYELRGRVENGKPVVTLTQPPPNAD